MEALYCMILYKCQHWSVISLLQKWMWLVKIEGHHCMLPQKVVKMMWSVCCTTAPINRNPFHAGASILPSLSRQFSNNIRPFGEYNGYVWTLCARSIILRLIDRNQKWRRGDVSFFRDIGREIVSHFGRSYIGTSSGNTEHFLKIVWTRKRDLQLNWNTRSYLLFK